MRGLDATLLCFLELVCARSYTHPHTHSLYFTATLDLSRVSSKLAADSKTFKWGAKKLNYLDALRKWAPCVGILAFIIIVLLWRAYF